MGGRGRDFLGGGGEQRGRTDESPIVWAGRNVAVTQNAMKVLGEENAKDAAEYIANAISFLTGSDDYTSLSIDDSASGSSYAHMRLFTGQMGINPKMYKDLSELKKIYDRDVESGFHPKGTGMTDVFVHEAAHRLDAIMARKNRLNKMTSTIVVPEAIQAVKDAMKQRGETPKTSEQIQRSLSGYGADYYKKYSGDHYVETFAEALADYNKNKNNANELSKEIVKRIQRYL